VVPLPHEGRRRGLASVVIGLGVAIRSLAGGPSPSKYQSPAVAPRVHVSVEERYLGL